MPLLRNRDWDHYILMFSKDAEIVMDEGTRHGRADIRERMATASERMATAAAGKPVRQSADLLTNVEVRVRGDIAHASSRFTFLAENEAHDFVVSGSGLYLDTWVRAGHLLQWTLIALVSRRPQRSCTRNSQRALNRYTGPWRRGARTSFWIPATRRFSTRANTARCRARAAGCENPRP
jgi:hypothetical protein